MGVALALSFGLGVVVDGEGVLRLSAVLVGVAAVARVRAVVLAMVVVVGRVVIESLLLPFDEVPLRFVVGHQGPLRKLLHFELFLVLAEPLHLL